MQPTNMKSSGKSPTTQAEKQPQLTLKSSETASLIPTELQTPWSTVGYFTYKRTYSRQMQQEPISLSSEGSTEPTSTGNRTEEWGDTIQRVIDSARYQLSVGFSEEEEQRLIRYMTLLKGTVAGRFLWQLGTGTVEKLGLLSLQNCAFTTIDEPVRPFTWAMDALMLGCGVGVNLQREYVYKLPPVLDTFQSPIRQDNASADFIVPDTREGWVRLLEYTLRSAFDPKAKNALTYSTQLVRGKGAPIKGFGGISSGPEDLCWGIGEIGRVLEERAGEQLRPIDCLDIINIIGAVVVAGNVRRSAIIAIGDHDDIEYLRAKRWDLGGVPNWRAMSNNSVVCNDIGQLPDEFWEGYKGNGEPYGLINLKLARSCGRLGETQYKDKKVRGFNPCAEQPLEDYETCCLSEIFLPNVESAEELLDLAKLLYRINKHSLMLPCHHPETESVVHKNMRMGIGITGYLQATDEQRNWLNETYGLLRSYDNEYSASKGFNPSIKLTTVKPSGTLSLLPGVTPGCHPAYATYMVRRIRVASNSPMVDTCREAGYKVEFQVGQDGTPDYGTVVIEFPFSYPEGTKTAAEMTAIDQLEVVKRLQTEWSDNAVSCTVYFKPEELVQVQEYLRKNYNKTFKSLSFLLHSEHGFKQPPLEEIGKEEFEELVARVKLITKIEEKLDFDADSECATGACPVR